jgi:hypothetical protein
MKPFDETIVSDVAAENLRDQPVAPVVPVRVVVEHEWELFRCLKKRKQGHDVAVERVSLFLEESEVLERIRILE